MADFNQILTDIKNQLGPLAEKDLKQFAGQGKQDAEAFLQDSEVKLEQWVQQLANNEIDQDEFTFLVESQKGMAEMQALEKASAGTVQIEQFRDSVFSVVINTALTAVAGKV